MSLELITRMRERRRRGEVASRRPYQGPAAIAEANVRAANRAEELGRVSATGGGRRWWRISRDDWETGQEEYSSRGTGRPE